MDRRSFLQSTCAGALGIFVGGSIIDLASVKTIRAMSHSGKESAFRDIPLRLEDTPDLKPVGGAYHLQIEDLDKDILIAHVSPEHYVAVDIKCTHKGCDVAYESETKMFHCPCHDSRYDLSGVPQSGPAKRPLTSYRVEITEEEVILKVPVDGDPPDSTAGNAVRDSIKSVAPQDSTTTR